MGRIGVLEDDGDFRGQVVTVLESRGHEVRGWGTIADARAGIDLFCPELLLLDIDLPDGCGLDVAHARRADGQKIPSIMLSSHGRETDILRGFVAGAVDYVTKPFSPDELLARVAVRMASGAAGERLPSFDLPEQSGLAFGRYQVTKHLGRGGHGEVFLALDTHREQAPVALKVLAPLAGEQVEARVRFVRETYAASRLRDPGIAAVHDVGAAQGRLYYAMEYVDGPTLQLRVDEQGALSEAELFGLASGLLASAAALELAGIVHRDIKPGNVMLRDGRADDPVLVDFGLAKLPFDRGLTHADMIMGTPAYLPPEVVIGGSVIDHRSDLYQVGLTLRFAWTAEGAFPECAGLELLNRIARDPLPPPSRTPPAWLEVVLDTLLAHDRDARGRSAANVLRLLGR